MRKGSRAKLEPFHPRSWQAVAMLCIGSVSSLQVAPIGVEENHRICCPVEFAKWRGSAGGRKPNSPRFASFSGRSDRLKAITTLTCQVNDPSRFMVLAPSNNACCPLGIVRIAFSRKMRKMASIGCCELPYVGFVGVGPVVASAVQKAERF